MSTLSDILNTGKQALLIQQLAMQVIGHNTSNVNTEGFSRRRLDLSTALPGQNFKMWHVGSGVDISYLGRIRDTLIDKQIRENLTTLGYWNRQDETLERIEEIFDDLEGTGISTELELFWSAWQDLSNEPEEASARLSLLQKAQSLSSSVRRTYSALNEQRRTLDEQIVGLIDEVNGITSQISVLNVQIVNTERAAEEASDLRDQRDLLLDKLASLINITTEENSDGAVNVYTGGTILVQLDRAIGLSAVARGTDGYMVSSIAVSEGGMPIEFKSGEIKSLLNLRDNEIVTKMEELDAFAVTLAQRVNEVHRTGYGLTNTNGIEFFSPDVTGAADLRVSALITDDPSRIATAASPDAPGDNSIALLIADIQQEKLLEDGRYTLDEYYRNMVLSLGATRAYAANQQTVEQSAYDNLENRRQSVSGVSMDEEMTRLIQVQQAYEAAAKVIKVVDEMTETLLSIAS